MPPPAYTAVTVDTGIDAPIYEVLCPGDDSALEAEDIRRPARVMLTNTVRLQGHARGQNASPSPVTAEAFQDIAMADLFDGGYPHDLPKAPDVLNIRAVCTAAVGNPGEVAELAIVIVEGVSPGGPTLVVYPVGATVQLGSTERTPVCIAAQYVVAAVGDPAVRRLQVFLQARILNTGETLTFYGGARIDVELVRKAVY